MATQSLESTRMTVVYHGPAATGKTANLLYLHTNLPCKRKGEFLSAMRRETEQYAYRYIFFDITPSEEISDAHNVSLMRLQCLPGAVRFPESRLDILLEADAIVFIADSQSGRSDANELSLKEMELVLQHRGYSLQEFPWVLQYNKRDLPNLWSIQELESRLNHVHAPYVEAIASLGAGVIETFQTLMNRIIVSKKEHLV